MAKVKCSKCGALAHCVIKGKAYCLDCKPNTEKMERPAPWPEPPVMEMEVVRLSGPGTSLKDNIQMSRWQRFVHYFLSV